MKRSVVLSRADAKRKKIARILKRLEISYGKRVWRSSGPCLDELVYAMLSQNTNMTNAESGYRQLRRRFRTWTEVLNADVSDLQRQIAVCGLARMRARRLQNLLRTIKQDRGRLDLQFLAGEPAPRAYEYLTSFFGIGPKTAAYTLLFSLGVPVFPVDNGIMRMSKRLQLVRPNAREREVEQTVERLARPKQLYPLHVLMFAHAKKMCRPKNPKCDECRLLELCPHGQRRVRHMPTVDPLPRRVGPIILSRFASDGLPKVEARDEA
jgi:endonuclease-3